MTGRGGRRGPAIPPQMRDPEMRRFFERFFGADARHAAGPGAPAGARRRLGLHHRSERHRRHQRPCGRRCRQGRGDDAGRRPSTRRPSRASTRRPISPCSRSMPTSRCPTCQFGDSGKVRVGDKVVAIGNPFGLGGTVTAGIVSATGREIGSGPYEDFLQVDAPINRGNSGGPTFNLRGDVVGVNTAIFSPSRRQHRHRLRHLVEPRQADRRRPHGRRQGRARLARRAHPAVDEDIAASLGLPKPAGALVAQVEPDSPAAEAGHQERRRHPRVRRQADRELRDLTRAVAATEAGSSVDLPVWRDGKETGRRPMSASSRAGEQVACRTSRRREPAPPGPGAGAVSPEMRDQLGLADSTTACWSSGCCRTARPRTRASSPAT